MGWDRLRERAERLLREPDNLFGRPTGRGYDYVRAGLTVTAVVLAALSCWCRLTVETDSAVHPALAPVLLVLAAPSYISGWLLWPFHLYVSVVVAAAVWYATLHAAGCLTGLRRCGRTARVGSAVAAAVGWIVGLAMTVLIWGGPG